MQLPCQRIFLFRQHAPDLTFAIMEKSRCDGSINTVINIIIRSASYDPCHIIDAGSFAPESARIVSIPT